jgi:uncharacterized protein involved in exopolysaccharide biosynthesis
MGAWVRIEGRNEATARDVSDLKAQVAAHISKHDNDVQALREREASLEKEIAVLSTELREVRVVSEETRALMRRLVERLGDDPGVRTGPARRR